MFGFLHCLAKTHRSYYYDIETGWYYLQSRYYDPVIHRFINADSYASTDTTDAISCNMFAYCYNNPISSADYNGKFTLVITETEVVGTTDAETEYKTVISVINVGFGIPIWDVDTREFYFSVSNKGLITFDNAQDNAKYLGLDQDSVWRRRLASEMISVAQTQVPGSLKGRTVSGVSFELATHYAGHCFNIKPSHTDKTDIGGYDIDPNADWFEHPLRNIKTIIAELLE